MRPLTLIALAACSAPPAARAPVPASTTPVPGAPIRQPVELVEHRFYAVPRTVDGKTLRLYTDSGGGLFIRPDAVARLGLATSTIDAGGETVEVATLPAFAPGAAIPSPAVLGGKLPIYAPEGGAIEGDGMLGERWFGGKVWTFDYGAGALWWRAPGDLPAGARVRLGFPADRSTNFPRIGVRIDGEAIDLLLDTGATVKLTAEALAAIGDGRAAERATSFIVATIFDRWRAKHPEWRVIEHADGFVAQGPEPIIEVPAVEVAGLTVGPVWFTRRADRNFHEYMSSMMDARVEGALGGSALRYVTLTIDYPNAVAVFEKR